MDQHFFGDFLAGELSSRFKGRPDLELSARGALEITNMIPFFPGGITMRPGFEYMGSIGSVKVRLVPFIISDSLSYVLEFRQTKIRFWKNGVQLTSNGSLMEITTAYTDQFALQFAQDSGKLYIASAQDKVKVLTMTRVDEFEFSDLQISGSATMPFSGTITAGSAVITNVPSTTGMSNGAVVTGAGIPSGAKIQSFDASTVTLDQNATLSKSGETFYYAISLPFGSSGNYPRAIAIHDGCLWLASTESEPQAIWRSRPFDYGNFTLYDHLVSESKTLREPMNSFSGTLSSGSTTISNIAAEALSKMKVGDTIIGPGIIYDYPDSISRIVSIGASSIVISNGVRAGLQTASVSAGGTGYVVGDVLAVLGGTGGTVRVRTVSNGAVTGIDIQDKGTGYASGGKQTSGGTGSGCAVTVTAENYTGVYTLYSSWYDRAFPEYETQSTQRDVITPACAFKKTIASDINEAILWLSSANDLIVGTTCGERVIPSGVNATNFVCRKQSAHGSARLQPVLFNDAIVFVGPDLKSLREYVYRGTEAQSYFAERVDLAADHILTGTTQLEYSSSGAPILWAVQSSGILIGCVHDRTLKISAFFRVQIAGALVESVCVVPESGVDTLYASVNRGGTRSLLRMGQLFDGKHLDEFQEKTVSNGSIAGISWITGAAHLVYDGAVYPITVTNQVAPKPDAVPNDALVLVGRLVSGSVKTMPLNSNPLKSKQVPRAVLRVQGSYPFQFGYEAVKSTAKITKNYSGDVQVPVGGSWDTEGSLQVAIDGLPLTILAIAIEANQGG